MNSSDVLAALPADLQPPKPQAPRRKTTAVAAERAEPEFEFSRAPDGNDYPLEWVEMPVTDPDDDTSGQQASGTAPCSDLANAERLADAHGADIRYVGTWGKWKTWDGTRWRDDDTGELMRRASDVARKTHVQAKNAYEKRGDDAAKAFLAFAKKSQDAAKLTAAIKVTSSLPSIAIHHADLDRDPWLLNARNGTIDLRTGELRAHRREDLLSKMIGCPYDARARCPIWDAFLLRVMGGDRELVQYLQRLIGYALTGETSDHVLAFFFGGGANGKTTFLQIIREMMGDYAIPAPRGLLFAGGNRHPTELAALHGARFVVCAEVAQGAAFDEALVKDLTGGDAISARRMNEDFWHFTPTHKLFLAGNHRPVVRGDDDGIWRRVKLIPWTVTIPKEDRDATLRDRLRAELTGILRWAVEGCRTWLEHGLGEPSAVTKATSGYRAESDYLGQFLNERCRFAPGASVPCKDLREAYEEWCKELGALPVGARTIGDRLRKNSVTKGGMRSKFDSTRFVDAWRGIRFATEAERNLVGSVG